MTAARARGTRWESAIVDYLRTVGAPHAERRAMAGRADKGDLAGIPGLVVEAKNTARIELSAWLDEAETERINAGAALAVVWHHRRGRASAADGFVTMSGATLVTLLRAAGYLAELPHNGGGGAGVPGDQPRPGGAA